MFCSPFVDHLTVNKYARANSHLVPRTRMNYKKGTSLSKQLYLCCGIHNFTAPLTPSFILLHDTWPHQRKKGPTFQQHDSFQAMKLTFLHLVSPKTSSSSQQLLGLVTYSIQSLCLISVCLSPDCNIMLMVLGLSCLSGGAGFLSLTVPVSCFFWGHDLSLLNSSALSLSNVFFSLPKYLCPFCQLVSFEPVCLNHISCSFAS